MVDPGVSIDISSCHASVSGGIIVTRSRRRQSVVSPRRQTPLLAPLATKHSSVAPERIRSRQRDLTTHCSVTQRAVSCQAALVARAGRVAGSSSFHFCFRLFTFCPSTSLLLACKH